MCVAVHSYKGIFTHFTFNCLSLKPPVFFGLFFVSLWDRDMCERKTEIYSVKWVALSVVISVWKEIKTDRRHCCCQYWLTRPFVCHPQSFYTNRFHWGSLALCFHSHTVSLSLSLCVKLFFPLFLPYYLAVMTWLFHTSWCHTHNYTATAQLKISHSFYHLHFHQIFIWINSIQIHF